MRSMPSHPQTDQPPRCQSVVRKLGPQVEPLADRIMTVSLQLLQTSAKEAAVAEDAFMLIGHLVNGKSGRTWFPSSRACADRT
jgi:hypothetical protein